MTVTVRLAETGFDPSEELRLLTAQAAGAGAIVSFSGVARDRAGDGAAVTALVLESYRSLTLQSMEAIVAAARARFAIIAVRVVHRAGRIAAGEPIVFVAVAAAHRRAAFEAADYVMDRLKTEAVFWKREEGPAGPRWIEPTGADHDDAARWSQDGGNVS